MKNNEDFFEFIDNLIKELEILEEDYTVKRLKSAEEISTVPGEILGALRLELRKLCEKKTNLRLNSRNGINEALNYLDKILGVG